ncbi:Uncharacterized protein PBTT_03102 [Plasmodiophora brassicae]
MPSRAQPNGGGPKLYRVHFKTFVKAYGSAQARPSSSVIGMTEINADSLQEFLNALLDVCTTMTTNVADGGERAAAAAARGVHDSKHATTLDAAAAGEFNKGAPLLAVTMATPASPEAGASAHGESRCVRSRPSPWSSTCSSMGQNRCFVFANVVNVVARFETN